MNIELTVCIKKQGNHREKLDMPTCWAVILSELVGKPTYVVQSLSYWLLIRQQEFNSQQVLLLLNTTQRLTLRPNLLSVE